MKSAMPTFSIKNRHGLKVVGNIMIPTHPVGCSFVMHGLGGTKEGAHIVAMANTLFSNGYTVVNFDATNSIGESEGKYENATMQFHYEDLVDVIEWARAQEWYTEPFVLAGHSLGAYAVARYAEDHPERVKAVFPCAPVVSGKLSFEAKQRFEPEKLKEWKESGWTVRTSISRPGTELRLPWSHMEERLKHDLGKNVSKLTMPVLLIVGENDGSCPPDHQKLFFDMLPANTPKEMHVIKGAAHTFRSGEHLDELSSIFDAWLKKIGTMTGL